MAIKACAPLEDRCALCGDRAAHKVSEDSDDYGHPLTSYVCCVCFVKLMRAGGARKHALGSAAQIYPESWAKGP